MTIDWSKAPEGATHHRDEYPAADWYKLTGTGVLFYLNPHEDAWIEASRQSVEWIDTHLTPRPSEPKPHTRDEALKFLVERLESWPTDIADAPLCPGWGWEQAAATIAFVNWGDDTIWGPQWRAAHPNFAPFVSVEDAQPATAKQPAPSGKGYPILGMVLTDLTNRALEGREKYGEALKANNGRNALWDAYQEALDLAMYLRQAIEERHRAQTNR